MIFHRILNGPALRTAQEQFFNRISSVTAMALQQTTQPHTPEAKILVLPQRADATKGFAAPTDEAVMAHALSESSQNTDRKLRSTIILANAAAWIAIAFGIRFLFF